MKGYPPFPATTKCEFLFGPADGDKHMIPDHVTTQAVWSKTTAGVLVALHTYTRSTTRRDYFYHVGPQGEVR